MLENFTEEQLDDLYNAINKLEKDLANFNVQIERLNERFQHMDKWTVSDILYRDKQIEQYADKFKSSAQNVVSIANHSPANFANILFKGDIDYEAQCQILAKISEQHETWKEIIAKWTTPIAEIMCSDREHQGAELLLNATHQLPSKYYSEGSIFIKNLLRVLATDNDRAVYWTIYVLWEGDYYYPSVVDAFLKLLRYSNWRMRAVIYDYLQTWKREYGVLSESYSLTFLDHVRKCVFSRYHSQLSKNMTNDRLD